MKILKITAIVFLAGFIAIFSYANLRSRSISERMAPIGLATYHIAYSGQADTRTLGQDLSQSPGITACSINPDQGLAGVTYLLGHTDQQQVASLLTAKGLSEVSLKTFAQSGGGCPVHKASVIYAQIIDFLDIR